MADMETRIEGFSEMMMGALGVYCGQYDGTGRLISSNCPFATVLDYLFSLEGSRQKAFDTCQKVNMPTLVMGRLALVWMAVPHTMEGELVCIHVLGPVFPSVISEANLLKSIHEMKAPLEWRQELPNQLMGLPVIQHTTFMQYGALLYYCMTKERISSADIGIVQTGRPNVQEKDLTSLHKAHSNYAFEQELFKAVETGNIHYRRTNQQVAVGVLSIGNPLRQLKNEIIVYITLSSRAALRGGLPDETAYGLCDTYIQMVEDEESATNLVHIGQQAFYDYLHRVHSHKQSQGISREIHNCMAYVESHLTDKIDYEEMARELGYNRNYLSSKFRKETGVTLSSYIAGQRIELAKIWLRGTNKCVHDIAGALYFGSDSYFSTLFHKSTGVTPSEYRDQKDAGGNG